MLIFQPAIVIEWSVIQRVRGDLIALVMTFSQHVCHFQHDNAVAYRGTHFDFLTHLKLSGISQWRFPFLIEQFGLPPLPAGCSVGYPSAGW